MPLLTHVNTDRLEKSVSLNMNIDGEGPLGHLIWQQRKNIPDYSPDDRYVVYCANTHYEITDDGFGILPSDYD